jgi:hypothetical protein
MSREVSSATPLVPTSAAILAVLAVPLGRSALAKIPASVAVAWTCTMALDSNTFVRRSL